MKKFFKSLAVLLALTLIVGVIPASAADDASLSMAKSKTLYIGGSQGAKEDGTECKIGAKKYISKMIKNFDADTMTITAESADETVAKVNKANRIIAKGIGTTTVKVAVYDADDAKLFAQDLKVVVKKNADAVTVTGIADGDSFKVGQTVDITLPRAGVDTDARALVVDNAEVVELKAGEKARTWTAKFLKAGDAKFTATAYQSKTYAKATQTVEINVKAVAPVATAVKQVADNKIEITYDCDIKDVITKDSFANDDIYYIVGETKVPFSLIEEVKTEGSVATLKFYSSFVANTVYYVAVADADDLTFTGAGAELKNVKTLVILPSTTAYAGQDNEIKYALYNEADVDITNAVTAGYTKNIPTFTVESDDAYLSDSTHIYFTDKGKTATIKGELYIGYDETTYAEIKVVASPVTLTSTEAPTDTYTGVIKYTVGNVLPTAKDELAKVTCKSDFATNDDVKLSFVFEKKDTNGEIYYVDAKTFGISKIEIGDQNIAMVQYPLSPVDVNDVTIVGLNAGTTNVILYTNYDKDDKDEFFRAFPITVKAARKVDHVAWKVVDQKLNAGVPGATATIVATIYDQYNEALKLEETADKTAEARVKETAKITWNEKSNVKVNIAASATQAWDDNLKLFVSETFTITYDSGAKVDQPQNAMLICEGNGVKENKSISVSNETEVANVKVDCTSATLDTGLTKATSTPFEPKTSVISLKTTGKNGFDIGTQPFVQVAKDPQQAVSAGALSLSVADGKLNNAGTEYTYYLVRAQYKADNADAAELADNSKTILITNNSITLKNIVDAKLSKGAYNFIFYKYVCDKETGKTRSVTVLGRPSVTVTNTDAAISVKIKSDVFGVYSDMFEIKFDGVDVSSTISDVVYEASADKYYVKSLKVTAETNELGDQQFDVTIGKLFKKNA